MPKNDNSPHNLRRIYLPLFIAYCFIQPISIISLNIGCGFSTFCVILCDMIKISMCVNGVLYYQNMFPVQRGFGGLRMLFVVLLNLPA